jgi:thiamine pyrophosphokinase
VSDQDSTDFMKCVALLKEKEMSLNQIVDKHFTQAKKKIKILTPSIYIYSMIL